MAGSLPLLDGRGRARGAGAADLLAVGLPGAPARCYGRAKLELEQEVLRRDGVVLRPGLVFGIGAGGMFGAMVSALVAARARRR